VFRECVLAGRDERSPGPVRAAIFGGEPETPHTVMGFKDSSGRTSLLDANYLDDSQESHKITSYKVAKCNMYMSSWWRIDGRQPEHYNTFLHALSCSIPTPHLFTSVG
jgi:hypothetical protein